MRTARHVALLRGINVGGRNKVAMADLRAALAEAGFDAVETYIQSGNVLFESSAGPDRLEADIEAVVEGRFGFPLVVVVRSHAQLTAVVDDCPTEFASSAETDDFDVVFLKSPLTAERAVDAIPLRDGVDQVWPGDGVVYFSRLSARRSESRLHRISAVPEYKSMTIRNWRTTTKLLAMLDARAG